MKIKIIPVYIILIPIVLVSYAITKYGFSDYMPEVQSIIWTIVFSSVIIDRMSVLKNGYMYFGILAGYLIRLFLLLLDLLTDHWLMALFNLSDWATFYDIGSQYYHGKFDMHKTYYPYMIRVLFEIFGDNIYLACLFNIFLEVLGMICICKTMELLEVSRLGKKIGTFLILISPYPIIYGIPLLREGIYYATLCFSIYYFTMWLKWEDSKYFIFSIIVMLPAIILNSVHLLALLPHALIFLKRQKAKINVTNICFMIAAVLGVVVLMNPSIIGFHGYLRIDADAGVTGTIKGVLDSRIASGGASQYLKGLSYSGTVAETIVQTPIRMIYFLFSPMPHDWRNLKDVVIFLADSCVRIVSIYLGIRTYMRCRKYETCVLEKYIIIAAILIEMAISFVFGWSTSTAGTAGRHRQFMIPLEILMISIYYGGNWKNERKKGKYCDYNSIADRRWGRENGIKPVN